MSPIELKARREALGLNQSDLAAVLHAQQSHVSAWEAGKKSRPAWLDDRLADLEEDAERVTDLACRALEQAAAAGEPGAVLFAYRDDADLWAAIPETDGLPAAVHRVALARAIRLAEVPATFEVAIEEKPAG